MENNNVVVLPFPFHIFMQLANLWFNFKDSFPSYCIVLKGWLLLPNALRPFQIYCAPPNLGITRT